MAAAEMPLEKEYYVRESDLAEEYPELPFTPEGRLDVREMAYQEILMEAPLTLLCLPCAGASATRHRCRR